MGPDPKFGKHCTGQVKIHRENIHEAKQKHLVQIWAFVFPSAVDSVFSEKGTETGRENKTGAKNVKVYCKLMRNRWNEDNTR